MLAYCIVSVSVLLVAGTEGILLCDGDCKNNTAMLDICMEPEDDPRRPIRLLGLFPCDSGVFRARGLVPASQMAIRQINDDTSLLAGYRLELLVNNTMCAAQPAVRSYIFQINSDHNDQAIHGIIGPGCSAAAMPVAELAQHYNLVLVSTASLPDLSDGMRFPTFFRIASSDFTAVDVNIALIMEYGWHQVSIVTENDDLFLALTDELNTRLAQNGIIVISNGLPYIYDDDDAGSIITTIQGSGARIVIMNVYQDSARMLFCLAFARGMIYPEYVWISHGWYTQNWWLDVEDTKCTVDEMQTAIQRSLAIHHFPFPTSEEEDAPTDVGYTPNEFWYIYEENTKRLGYSIREAITLGRYFYDAVWMIAFAFNNSIEILAKNNQTLEDFTYENNEIREVFVDQLSVLNFSGVSGHVFIENRERQPNLRISQYRYDDYGNIISPEFARLPPSGGNLYYTNNESSDTVWPVSDESNAATVTTAATVGITTGVISFIIITIFVVGIIAVYMWKKKKNEQRTKQEGDYYSTINETKIKRFETSKPEPIYSEINDKQNSKELQYTHSAKQEDEASIQDIPVYSMSSEEKFNVQDKYRACSISSEHQVEMQNNPAHSSLPEHQFKMQNDPAYSSLPEHQVKMQNDPAYCESIPSECQVKMQNDPAYCKSIPSECQVKMQNDPVYCESIPSECQVKMQNDPAYCKSIPSECQVKMQSDPAYCKSIPSECQVKMQSDPAYCKSIPSECQVKMQSDPAYCKSIPSECQVKMQNDPAYCKSIPSECQAKMQNDPAYCKSIPSECQVKVQDDPEINKTSN